MSIHDSTYQHWGGTFKNRVFRWAPMVRYHLQDMLRRKLVWLVLFLSFVPCVVLSVGIYVAWRVEERIDIGEEFIPGMVEFISETSTGRTPPGLIESRTDEYLNQSVDERHRILTRVGFYSMLIYYQGFFVLFITTLVGSGLIARDIKSNALEIYLTKPMTAADYILGKLAVIAVFVFLVTFVPSCLLFVAASSLWDGYASAAWTVLPRLAACCLVAAFVNGMVILGLSSLAKSARFASVIWFALCFLTLGIGTTLFAITKEPIMYLTSYRASFEYVFDALLGSDLIVFTTANTDQGPAPLIAPVLVLSGYVLLSLAIMRRTIRGASTG